MQIDGNTFGDNYMEDLTNKILGLAKKYLKYPKAAVNAAISNAARIEYTSSGTGYLEGYYSPSHIEVFCSGCKRGRKIKKLKPVFDGYKYYFSADNEITLIEKFNGIGVDSQELLIREGDYLYGLYYSVYDSSPSLDYIMITRNSDGMVQMYIDSSVGPLDVSKKTDMNNLHVYSHYQEYFYSDEPEPSIIKVGLKHTEYRTDTDSTNVYAQEEIDLTRHGEPGEPIKVDNQKALAKNLKSKINKKMSLDEAIDAFLSVISEAEPNDEELLLYEAYGNCPVEDSEVCEFGLIRQTPAADGEYYQLYLCLQYETCDELKTLDESHWHDKTDGDLREYILNSEAYKLLKDRKILKIKSGVDKT